MLSTGKEEKFGAIDAAAAGTGAVEVIADQFKYGKKNAKMTGCLLAYALAMLFPFPTQSISLVGFSLGNQVIQSCLECLHSLRANHIIHHVTFLAAAIDRMDRLKTRMRWADILGTVLPGEIKNVHTTTDWVLLGYSISEGQ